MITDTGEVEAMGAPTYSVIGSIVPQEASLLLLIRGKGRSNLAAQAKATSVLRTHPSGSPAASDG